MKFSTFRSRKSKLQGFSRDLLAQHFFYNPEDGVVVNRWTGTLCVSPDGDGYYRVRFKGKTVRVHQLAFFLYYGWLPPYVDHKDRIRSNNRIDNLRPATSSQNQANKSIQHNNTSGHAGVTYRKDTGKWRARLQLPSTRLCLGDYSTKEAASRAYNKAKLRIHKEYARLNHVEGGDHE